MACLPDVFSLGLLEGDQKVVEAGVAGVLPVVLDARPLQEAQVGQLIPLRLLVEGDVCAADLVVICNIHLLSQALILYGLRSKYVPKTSTQSSIALSMYLFWGIAKGL